MGWTRASRPLRCIDADRTVDRSRRDASYPGEVLMASDERCPRCGSDRVVPIAYGLPSAASAAAAEAIMHGDVILGGCVIRDGDPDVGCLACRFRWVRSEGSAILGPANDRDGA
jgi:hypothetical protein